MNSTVILSIALIIFAVAIFAFLLILLIPSRDEHPEGLLADKIFHGWAATDLNGDAFLYSSRPHRNTFAGQWIPTAPTYENPIEVHAAIKDALHLPAWNEDPILIELWATRLEEPEPTTTESTDPI